MPKEKKFFNHLSDLFKVGTLIDRRMFKGRCYRNVSPAKNSRRWKEGMSLNLNQSRPETGIRQLRLIQNETHLAQSPSKRHIIQASLLFSAPFDRVSDLHYIFTTYFQKPSRYGR
jgi:hypothetical protein